jgi:hypothetical protein
MDMECLPLPFLRDVGVVCVHLVTYQQLEFPEVRS